MDAPPKRSLFMILMIVKPLEHTRMKKHSRHSSVDRSFNNEVIHLFQTVT
jgi:hypothetical protein